MDNQPVIWLTRPREDSQVLAADLASHHIRSLISPALRIIHLPHATMHATMPKALLLTSRHAAYALAELPASWRALPVYCVGSATARAASEHGCSHIIPGNADVLALLPHIVADMHSGSELLYLSGSDTRTDVAALLASHSIRVATKIVYSASPEMTITDEVMAAITNGTLDAVVFFSPRSAHIVGELLTKAGTVDATRQIAAYCLSLAIAASAGKLPWKALHVSRTPSQRALRELVVSKLGKPV